MGITIYKPKRKIPIPVAQVVSSPSVGNVPMAIPIGGRPRGTPEEVEQLLEQRRIELELRGLVYGKRKRRSKRKYRSRRKYRSKSRHRSNQKRFKNKKFF